MELEQALVRELHPLGQGTDTLNTIQQAVLALAGNDQAGEETFAMIKRLLERNGDENCGESPEHPDTWKWECFHVPIGRHERVYAEVATVIDSSHLDENGEDENGEWCHGKWVVQLRVPNRRFPHQWVVDLEPIFDKLFRDGLEDYPYGGCSVFTVAQKAMWRIVRAQATDWILATVLA